MGDHKKTPMTSKDASRIQASYAKKHGGQVHSGTFPARAQSAAAENAKSGEVPSGAATAQNAAEAPNADQVSSGSFAARAQAAAAQNANSGRK